MKNVFLLTVALVTLTTEAQANTIQGAYIGCVTREALDEFVDAAVANDNRQMQALGTVCISIQGLQYSIVDQGFSKSQIRVYGNGQSALLWAVSEAIR